MSGTVDKEPSGLIPSSGDSHIQGTKIQEGSTSQGTKATSGVPETLQQTANTATDVGQKQLEETGTKSKKDKPIQATRIKTGEAPNAVEEEANKLKRPKPPVIDKSMRVDATALKVIRGEGETQEKPPLGSVRWTGAKATDAVRSASMTNVDRAQAQAEKLLEEYEKLKAQGYPEDKVKDLYAQMKELHQANKEFFGPADPDKPFFKAIVDLVEHEAAPAKPEPAKASAEEPPPQASAEEPPPPASAEELSAYPEAQSATSSAAAETEAAKAEEPAAPPPKTEAEVFALYHGTAAPKIIGNPKLLSKEIDLCNDSSKTTLIRYAKLFLPHANHEYIEDGDKRYKSNAYQQAAKYSHPEPTAKDIVAVLTGKDFTSGDYTSAHLQNFLDKIKLTKSSDPKLMEIQTKIEKAQTKRADALVTRKKDNVDQLIIEKFKQLGALQKSIDSLGELPPSAPAELSSIQKKISSIQKQIADCRRALGDQSNYTTLQSLNSAPGFEKLPGSTRIDQVNQALVLLKGLQDQLQVKYKAAFAKFQSAQPKAPQPPAAAQAKTATPSPTIISGSKKLTGVDKHLATKATEREALDNLSTQKFTQLKDLQTRIQLLAGQESFDSSQLNQISTLRQEFTQLIEDFIKMGEGNAATLNDLHPDSDFEESFPGVYDTRKDQVDKALDLMMALQVPLERVIWSSKKENRPAQSGGTAQASATAQTDTSTQVQRVQPKAPQSPGAAIFQKYQQNPKLFGKLETIRSDIQKLKGNKTELDKFQRYINLFVAGANAGEATLLNEFNKVRLIGVGGGSLEPKEQDIRDLLENRDMTKYNSERLKHFLEKIDNLPPSEALTSIRSNIELVLEFRKPQQEKLIQPKQPVAEKAKPEVHDAQTEASQAPQATAASVLQKYLDDPKSLKLPTIKDDIQALKGNKRELDKFQRYINLLVPGANAGNAKLLTEFNRVRTFGYGGGSLEPTEQVIIHVLKDKDLSGYSPEKLNHFLKMIDQIKKPADGANLEGIRAAIQKAIDAPAKKQATQQEVTVVLQRRDDLLSRAKQLLEKGKGMSAQEARRALSKEIGTFLQNPGIPLTPQPPNTQYETYGAINSFDQLTQALLQLEKPELQEQPKPTTIDNQANELLERFELTGGNDKQLLRELQFFISENLSTLSSLEANQEVISITIPKNLPTTRLSQFTIATNQLQTRANIELTKGLMFAIRPEKQEEIEEILKGNDGTQLSIFDINKLEGVIANEIDHYRMHTETPDVEKTQILESALERFKIEKRELYEANFAKADPTVKKHIQDLQEIVGQDCPIPLNIKLALLEACKEDGFLDKFKELLVVASKAKAESTKTYRQGKTFEMQKTIMEYININLFENLSPDLQRSMLALSMYLGVKTGETAFTQFVTDTMSLTFQGQSTTTGRYLANVKKYQNPSVLARLSAGERNLAEQGFIPGANEWWEKTSWSEKSGPSDQMILTWTGGVAIAKKEEDVQILEKSLPISFDSLGGPLTQAQKVSAMKFLEDWMCFVKRGEKYADVVRAVEETERVSFGETTKFPPSGKIKDIPRAYREALSPDKELWKKVNEGTIEPETETAILEKYKQLINEATTFKKTFEREVTAAVLDLGTAEK